MPHSLIVRVIPFIWLILLSCFMVALILTLCMILFLGWADLNCMNTSNSTYSQSGFQGFMAWLYISLSCLAQELPRTHIRLILGCHLVAKSLVKFLPCALDFWSCCTAKPHFDVRKTRMMVMMHS